MHKEEFKSENSRDFQARYGMTFGWYEKSPDNRILVQLMEASSGRLIFQDKDKLNYEAVADKGNVFCFIPVERQLHNVPGDIWYTSRIPARQWKRGMCAQNTRIKSITSGKNLSVTFDTVHVLFNPDSSLANSFRSNLEGSIALSPTFAITFNKVYLYDVLIGSYKKGIITLNDGLFIQEVKDVVARNKYNIQVEVKVRT